MAAPTPTNSSGCAAITKSSGCGLACATSSAWWTSSKISPNFPRWPTPACNTRWKWSCARTASEMPPFAIVGLGKLGGGEIDYGSDLDI